MEQQKCNFKIVLLGDEGVGRGTLLKDFKSGSSDKDYLGTIGAEFRFKDVKVEGVIVRLMIWNVSYDEEFRFFFPSFIKESRVALLLFDITRLESLTYLSDLPEEIRRYAGEVPIYLIANKIDLTETREVTEEEGRNFAEKHNLKGYMEISAKIRQDCGGLFEMIANFLYNSYKDLV